MIVLDTSGLLATIDSSQRFHSAARGLLSEVTVPSILSPFVLAEPDYLLTTRVSNVAELALLEEVANGAYALAPFSGRDVDEARHVIERYEGLGIGLADASVVVLANRHGTLDVLTIDERHFRVLRGPDGRPF